MKVHPGMSLKSFNSTQNIFTFIHSELTIAYGTALTQVYDWAEALDVTITSEHSIAFWVLMKHVCSLTTNLQVTTITCEWNHYRNHWIHFCLALCEWNASYACKLTSWKDYILYFAILICFFSHCTMTNIIATTLFFLLML